MAIMSAPSPTQTPVALGDFFAKDIRELDLQRSWKYAVRNPSMYNGRRLEYVSWRRWFQQKFHLPTLPAEELNWARDPNECWLYGPIPCPSSQDLSIHPARASPRTAPPPQYLTPFLEQLNLMGAEHRSRRALKFTSSRRDLRCPPDPSSPTRFSSATKTPPTTFGAGSDDPLFAAFLPHSPHVEHIVAPMAPISPPTETFASTPGPSSPLEEPARTSGPLRSHRSSRDLGATRRASRAAAATRAAAVGVRRPSTSGAAASATPARSFPSTSTATAATTSSLDPRRATSDVSVGSSVSAAALALPGRRARFSSETVPGSIDRGQRPPFYFVDESDDDSGDDAAIFLASGGAPASVPVKVKPNVEIKAPTPSPAMMDPVVVPPPKSVSPMSVDTVPTVAESERNFGDDEYEHEQGSASAYYDAPEGEPESVGQVPDVTSSATTRNLGVRRMD
ncbi:hypothetical protein M427DRAFT_132537 [Gonapodya prolifera JEL478]|uniref:Nitrogen regulatory protein areA GATA-like domain-containing protein n=1 Tax=Gonapodya prolifera (strain JEL478) TaxID=1344416 RepID=A0A139APY9_GONPJ|nr:hypothetical protein M427DRAFT_132537 [Gonapodya prolifera JEL478]|eukprot:KXS18573.1 hypothetical protein M427DRAFT_132537 [Gonapodya prolifera JEL478]